MKAIIFDLLGVVIDEENIASKKLHTFLSNPDISSEYLKERYANGLKIGKLTHEEFWAPLVKDDWEQFEQSFLKTLRVFDDAYPTLNQLSEKYKIGAISEIPSKWAETILKNNSIYNFFDVLILSDEFGTTKGSDSLYQAMKEKIGYDFDELIYIDDKLKNLDMPKKLGMIDVWFKRKEQEGSINPKFVVENLTAFCAVIENIASI